MGEPAFLAMGDLHLDPLIWKKHRHIRGDAYQAFSSIVSLAREHEVPLVLVGDIFHTIKPRSDVLQWFRRQMDLCVQADIPVYALQGNHDKQPVPWYVAVHDHVQHIGDGTPVDIGVIRCVGLDYDLKDQIQERMSELSALEEKPECLFLHQAARQALRFEQAWNLDLEWVPEGIPLTVMADIHIEWEQPIRPGQLAAYTSVSHARSITQAGPKTALMVYDDLTIRRLPIDYRDIQRFQVSAPDQVRALEQWLAQVWRRPHLLPPLAWVIHTPGVAADIGRIAGEWADQALFIREQVGDPQALALDLEDELDQTEELISVPRLLATLVDPEAEPEAYQFILDLIDDNNSVLDTIRAHREAFTGKQQE